MLANVIQCLPDVSVIAKANGKNERLKLVNKAKRCVINAISEIAHNCLKGNIPLTECKKKKLKRYQKTLRLLAKPKSITLTKKRELIGQRGGFLNLLLPSLVGLLSTAISSFAGGSQTK
jgi:hypothetical protein